MHEATHSRIANLGGYVAIASSKLSADVENFIVALTSCTGFKIVAQQWNGYVLLFKQT